MEPFERGIEVLKEMGFRVIIGDHVYATTLGYAASPGEKASDINAMFADPSIRAIICSQGGDTANACLPYLAWNTIRENPKVFLGMSDITVLLNAIYAKTGLVTFHGHDVIWGLGGDLAPYDLQEFVGRLIEGRIGKINRHGQRETIRGGMAEGTLLGGNLKALLKLAGTPYFPNFSKSILFIEGLRLTAQHCDFMLNQLKQIGVFEDIQGVVIGYIQGLDNDPDAPAQMGDVLLHITAEHDFPILKANDFGHGCPNTVLPVGARVAIDADAREMQILEDCLATSPSEGKTPGDRTK